MAQPVAIVLDSNQRSALAATRSLGRRGIEVINGESTRRNLAGASQQSARTFSYPDPRTDQDGFIACLEFQCNSFESCVLLPASDLTTITVLANSDRFARASLPYPEKHTFEEWTDKGKLMAWGRTNGMAVPEGELLERTGDLGPLGRWLGYPLVVKPVRSEFYVDGTWRRSQVSVVQSQSDLEACVEANNRCGTQPLLLQRYIDGRGAGIFALYRHGKPVGFFAHRRIREKPPSGGISVVSESVLPAEELQSRSQRLLDSARWHGVAMIEYRMAPDGTPYLMEVNGRLWGSLQLAIYAGFDFPYLLYQVALDRRCEQPSYQAGVRNRWLLGDLDHLLLSCRSLWRDRKPITDYLRLMKGFLNFGGPKQNIEVLSWRDPGPFLLELLCYLTALFRRS